MSASDKSLVFLRHAKSAYPAGVSDIDRPLAPRGQHQAPLTGEWINKHVGPFDLILCSPAERTRQTLHLAKLSGPVQFIPELFAEDHLVYLDIIRSHGKDAMTLAVVGHQPAIAATTLALARNRDDAAAKQIEAKYPTASAALLLGKRDWAQLETGHMALKEFYVPPRKK